MGHNIHMTISSKNIRLMFKPFLVITSLLILQGSIAKANDISDTNDVSANVCQAYQHDLSKIPKQKPDYTFSDSLIWQAEKNGRVNYLYGTIHTQDMMATRFPPQVRLGIYQSRHYLMEIELSEESNRVFREAMFFNDDRSLGDDLEPGLVTLLGKQLTHYGMVEEDAMRIKPWAALSTIGAPKPTRSPSLDQVLMNYARSRGLEIIGIETMQELVESLASIAYDDQLAILKDTICNRPSIIADTKTLVDLHMRNDLKGIIDFNAEPKPDEALFERYLGTMVNERNLRMFERVLPYFEQGESFVAVGALHLPGERGLLNLLKQAGFELIPM